MIVILFSLNAFALTDESSGLECSMIYKNSDAFSNSHLVSSAWMVDGDELEGKAVVTDGDGNTMATMPAHSITIKEKVIDLNDFWTVTVYNSEKTIIGIVDFSKVDVMAGESGSIKTTFEVQAYEETGEDPIEYNILEVVCKNVVFAG